MAKAQKSQDGVLRATVRVDIRLNEDQLADYLWSGLTVEQWDAWTPEMTLSSAEVRAMVADKAYTRGNEFFVEDDSKYERRGGREWALAIVRKVYGFPKGTT